MGETFEWETQRHPMEIVTFFSNILQDIRIVSLSLFVWITAPSLKLVFHNVHSNPGFV